MSALILIGAVLLLGMASEEGGVGCVIIFGIVAALVISVGGS